MKYNFNGKEINISDKEIAQSMKLLDITKEEAIEMWLDDNGYTDNEEQIALDKSASAVKIDMETKGGKACADKEKKPRTKKNSSEKQEIYDFLTQVMAEKYGKITVLTENKLFGVEINGKFIKIDVIEQKKAQK